MSTVNSYSTKEEIHLALANLEITPIVHSRLITEFEAKEKAAKVAKQAQPKQASEKALAVKEKQLASAQFNSDLLRESLTEISIIDSLNAQRKSEIDSLNAKFASQIETQLNEQTQAYLKKQKDLSAKDYALRAGYLAKCKQALEKIQFAGVFLLSTGEAIEFSKWENLVDKLGLRFPAKILTAKEKKENGFATNQAYALHFDSGAILLHDTGKRFVCTQRYYERLFAGAPLCKSQLTDAQKIEIANLGQSVSGFAAEIIPSETSASAIFLKKEAA